MKIGDEHFTDGGLRQNTPMSPAIRPGADRMLLVSLRHVAPQPKVQQMENTQAFPKPLFLAGKALNALLLDHTEYDLARMPPCSTSRRPQRPAASSVPERGPSSSMGE